MNLHAMFSRRADVTNFMAAWGPSCVLARRTKHCAKQFTDGMAAVH